MDFYQLIKYLDDMKKEDIVKIGTSLGLDYNRLCGLTMEQTPHEMIQWWLGKRDNVMEISGTPMLKSLLIALEKNGLHGHANKIKACDSSTDEICKLCHKKKSSYSTPLFGT